MTRGQGVVLDDDERDVPIPVAVDHGRGGCAGPTADRMRGAGDTTASKPKTVKVVNFAFKPATLAIAKGSSVSFSNTSTATHTATRVGAFDTGRIKPGKTVTVRFRQKGSFPYHCLIHPSRRGKIVVD